MLEAIAAKLPRSLAATNGKAFFAGRTAFEQVGSLYVLGFNPGGDPNSHRDETISSHTNFVLGKAPADWSAYVDEAWQGNGPTMQRRMRHFFSGLGLDPRQVPSSNLIFTRSRRIADLGLQTQDLIQRCWPVHAEVLVRLSPRAVICLGGDCAEVLREKLGARTVVAEFVERNARGWASTVWKAGNGRLVVKLAHPSIADWTAPATDPLPMLRDVLGHG